MIEDTLGDPILIGVNLIVFGLALQWADGLLGERPDDDYRKKDTLRSASRRRARGTGRV